MTYAFSDIYREECFHAWYGANHPSKFDTILELLPVDEHGKKPSKLVLGGWLNQDWKARADELDAKAIELADNQLIAEKARMLQDQAQRGKDLQEAGMAHIKAEGFDSSSAAVQAVIRGADLERSSRGIGELLVRMSKMTEGDLKQEIMKRLEFLQNEQIVDADVKEESGQETDNSPDQEADSDL